ncbi:MAG: zinc transporter ZupT [Sedimentisphaerales bacterium]|nr:zinc transporter ZupT [Sedimentisphaerales bacterium]
MDGSQNVAVALGLTMLAGLSTGIGSAIAYFIRRPKVVYLSFSLGLSAGVMIYVSFVELLPQASAMVGQAQGVLAFFVGIAFIAIVDLLVPEPENPHNLEGLDEPEASQHSDRQLMRMGVMTAAAIGIHNLPEGMATFASALSDVRLGIFIAIAIAIHNIPEGIAVSVPIFYATRDKSKAFFYSFLSGVAEPVGALFAYLVLMPFLTPGLLAGILAFVAGIMIYISLDELLPMAHRYGHGHLVIGGIILGMLVMAVSLLLL